MVYVGPEAVPPQRAVLHGEPSGAFGAAKFTAMFR